MKQFKQLLLVVLVALTSSVTVNAQTETRTVGINNLTDLDDVALLGEWTVIEHTNNSNPINKIIFADYGSFENNINAHRIERKDGTVLYYSEYWTSGSMMGRFTLHMIYESRVAHFVIDKFEEDDMVLSTYDQKEVITLKRNYTQEPEQSGPQIIDLGLSVNWASYNLGASAPEEAGELYYWNTSLPESMWGEGWRLPTENEARELVNSCRWEEVNLNGEKVMKATGPNGNFVLFPNTNCISAGSPLAVTENGFYWTSTLDFDIYVYYLLTGKSYLQSTGAGVYYGTAGNLNYSPKLAIRPVTKKPAPNKIQLPSIEQRANTNVYDVNGRIVKNNVDSHESLDNLPKGIYFVDGKKIVK